MSRNVYPWFTEGCMPEFSGRSFHVVSCAQSAFPLSAICQELRRFVVFAASQYLPSRGRWSCTETGCIHLRPRAWIFPIRPTGDVAKVGAGLVHCGLRVPQLAMPYEMALNLSRCTCSFWNSGKNVTGTPYDPAMVSMTDFHQPGVLFSAVNGARTSLPPTL